MQDKLIEVLNRHYPRWWLEWATRDDLVDLVEFPNVTPDVIRYRVASRLFHPILSAAVEANVMAVVEQSDD